MPSQPEYLGGNDLGLPVWEIEEGGQRPMVDAAGMIKCRKCGEIKLPLRLHIGFAEQGTVEWGALACRLPGCGNVHCIMRVQLMGRMKAEGADMGVKDDGSIETPFGTLRGHPLLKRVADDS